MKKYSILIFVFLISVLAFANDFALKTSKEMSDTPDVKKDFYKEGVLKDRDIKGSVLCFSEGFESGTIPAGWTTSDGNGDGYNFYAATYGTGICDPSSDNGGSYYALYDDDAAGTTAATIEQLTSPAIFTGFPMTELTLMYDFNMQDYGGYGYFETQIRTFEGAAWSGWTQFAFHTVDQVSSDTLSLDALLGADSVQINILFNDENIWGWGMGIDNIELLYGEPDSNDITPSSSVIPQTVISPVSSFLPTIEVTNNGIKDQMNGFMLTCDIYDDNENLLYTDTLNTLDTLYSLTSEEYEMTKSFQPEYLKTYKLVAITHLAGDTIFVNDTLEFDFRTHDLEVGLSNFIYTANMNYTTDYGFSVDVTNNGGQTADFNVKLLIEKNGIAVYDETYRFDALLSGNTNTAIFPTMTAPHELGQYDISVFSEMPADYDRSNDTITGTALCATHWENIGADAITARLIPGTCTYNDGYFVIGGLYSSTYSVMNEVRFYSPDSGWFSVTTLPVPLCATGCAVFDGKLYVVGGADAAFTTSNLVQIYDIAGNSWSNGTVMPISLFSFGGGYSNGKMYIIGGSMNSSFPDYCYNFVYTPAADTTGGTPWDTIAPCPRGTSGLILGANPAANELDSLIMVGGDYRGVTYGYYIYNINSNSWITIPNPPSVIGGQNPGLVYSNGSFKLIGGCLNGSWGPGTARTFTYNMADSSWVDFGTILNTNNYAFATAALPDNQMYVSGGFPNSLILERTYADNSSFDTYAPFITHTDPIHKTVSVPFDKTITVDFSEKIDTSAGFGFTCTPNPGLLLGVWSSSLDTLLIFHEDFSVNTTYYIEFFNVYDTIGFAMKSVSVPNPFGFSTGITGINGNTKSNIQTKLDMPNTNVTNNFVRFDYSSAGESNVSMDIYSVNGSLVKNLVNGKIASGTHKIIWNLNDNMGKIVPSGTYIYKLTSGKYTASGKLTVIR